MNKSFITVLLINIIMACSAQVFYWSLPDGTIDFILFQLVIFPLVIVLTNTFLWTSNNRIAFYQHSLSAYLAFFASGMVSFILSIDPSKELPPGEIILFADVLFIFVSSILQLLVLLTLNLFIYIFYRMFFLQKRWAKKK